MTKDRQKRLDLEQDLINEKMWRLAQPFDAGFNHTIYNLDFLSTREIETLINASRELTTALELYRYVRTTTK